MNTEHIFSEQTFLFLIVVYMLVNVFDDVRYLKTKNIYHYSVALILIIYSVFIGQLFDTLVIGIYTLVFFTLYGMLPKISLGAGDIKMLFNVMIFINLWSPDRMYDSFLMSVAIYMLISFLTELLIRTVRKKWTGKNIRPEAPVILITMAIAIALNS